MDGQSDRKPKFLPRSVQASQPAVSSKSKRRVTVEDDNAGDEESDRRSVFERLGPGGSQRHDKQKHHDFHEQSYSKGGKKRESDKSPDNLRLTFKGRQAGSKDQEGKVRSQVVVRKSGGGGSDDDTGEESDSWSIDKLDYKKELELEQKRKELQQALSALEEDDKRSESSGSDSSPERSHKKKKDKSSKKKEKKKHKKAAVEKEPVIEKPKEGKRKHESDEDEAQAPHKKRKKKKQDKKQDHERPSPQPPPLETSGKHKSRAPHKSSKDADLYDPESPTSAARTGSGDVSIKKKKRSSSLSPKPKGGKGKKKKKKMKAEMEVALSKSSKKLLSPLKKVLKVKKGPGSVTSSRRSRSESRDTRRHSRSESSSSSESSSPTPSKRKRPTSTMTKDVGRKSSKSQEKRKHRDTRSSSSSSSSSDSDSSSGGRRMSASRRKARKAAHLEEERPQIRGRKGQSPPSSGKDVHRRKRGTSADSYSQSRDRAGGSDAKRGGRKDSAERGRPRGRKEEVVPQSRDSSDRRKVSQSRGRGSIERDNRGDRDTLRRDGKGDSGRPTERDRDRGRDDRKPVKRGAEVRKDEPPPPSRERDRESGRGGDAATNQRGRDRRAGGSMDRESRDERGHRGAGFNSNQQERGERGGRFGPRDGDRDRHSYDESPGGRFPGNDGQRGGQFGMDRDRQRPGFERGGADFDQRDGFDNRGDRGRHGFQGPGRGQGRDRSWDDRGKREGGEGFREDWEGGREGRGRGGFGEFRGGGDERGRGREFGRGRDDRRGGGMGGREDRLLPHLGGGGDGGKVPGPDSHFGGSDSGRGPPRRPGYRDDGSRIQDWKGREGSHDSRGKGSERDVSRSRHGADDNDGRISRSSGGKSDATKDRVPERQADRPNDRSDRQGDRLDRNYRQSDRQVDRQSDRGSERPDRDTGRGGKVSDKSGAGSKQSSVMKVKSETIKEDSPLTREETSLASLFSQTESVAVKKKSAAKSFGGKKSPKSADEGNKQTDKSRSSLAGRGLGGRGRRPMDRRQPASRSADSVKGREEEREKAGSMTSQKDSPKPKRSRTPSPKGGSQKSGESPKPRHSQTRPERRLSQSPESRKDSSRPSRSPVPPKRGDMMTSVPASKRSPAPSSTRGERDRKETAGRKISPAPSTGSSRDRRRKEDEKPRQESELSKKRGRSKSRSGSESRTQPGLQPPEEKKRRKSSDSESLPAKLDGGDIAAAMLGDALDDGQQDEKVFSDWSDDDDADSILMGGESRKHQVEDLDYHGFDQPRHRSPGRYTGGDLRQKLDYEREGIADIGLVMEKPALEKNIPNVKIVEDIQKEKPAREKRRRNTEDEGYEEISSDENDLDEEGEKVTKRSIVSILDIDLAALMPSPNKVKAASSGPTFERFKAASIFSELGLSRAYAGDKLYKEVIDTCQKQLEEMEGSRRDESTEASGEVDPSVKTEIKEESEPSTSEDQSASVKSEPSSSTLKSNTDSIDSKPSLSHTSSPKSATKTSKTLTSAPKPQFKLYSSVPAYHRMLKAKAQQRASLLKNSGLFYKALTARRDLDIRRQLCKIDPKYDQSAVYPSGALDPELYSQCLQIFKQRRPPDLVQTPTSQAVS